jgi:hypothetical protein
MRFITQRAGETRSTTSVFAVRTRVVVELQP